MRRRLPIIGWIVLVACALLIAGALLGLARAHEAASGWAYDAGCCGNTDCREIPSSAVQAVNGGWLVKATGEIIPDRETKRPPDQRFHRCMEGGRIGGKTLCLYVPEFGS